MDNMALVVAGVAAAAIILIAIGVATSGGSGISDRLERYAAKPKAASKAAASGQGGVADLIAQSATLNSLNRVVEQRDFGANLARDIARADLKLKPSEFLMIWRHRSSGSCPDGGGVGRSRHRKLLPPVGSPRFLPPRFWLAAARTAGRRLNKQLPDTITLLANALGRLIPSRRSSCRPQSRLPI